METNEERLDRIENSGEGVEEEDFQWLLWQVHKMC